MKVSNSLFGAIEVRLRVYKIKKRSIWILEFFSLKQDWV